MDAVNRITEVLDYIAQQGKPCSVSEISKKLVITKSSISRTLSSMEKQNLVLKDSESDKYELSTWIIELVVKMLSNVDIRSIARPYMEELSRITDETTQLNIRTGYEVIVIDRVLPDQSVIYAASIGSHWPLWVGANAKSILAFLSEIEIGAVMSQFNNRQEQRYASGTIMKAENIMEDLLEIKKNGFAISVAELKPDAIGVAAPIIVKSGKVTGSLSIAAPVFRVTNYQANQFSTIIKEMANEIGSQLLYM